MSTSLRMAPKAFIPPPEVDLLTLTTFVPGAILHAAELNDSFASVLPLTGGAITTGGVLLDYRLSQPDGTDPNAPNSGLLVRWTNTATPGPLPPVNIVSAPINVVASDYAGAITSIWGVSVSMNVSSTMFGTSGVGPWPQHVGGSFTVSKSGNCYAVGVHTSPRDTSNNPSSLAGPLHGIELSHQSNNDDDAGNSGFPGVRFGIHMAQASNIASGSGGVPAVFAIGYNHGNSGGAVTKSIFCALDSVTYQVLDARRATAPSGYTDPVAAVRMAPGQIVDFKGATTNNNTPGWVGAAGSYLQYFGNARLRYVSGGNEIFSIRDDGLVQLEGSLFITASSAGQPSITILEEEFVSFDNAGNRTLMFTAVGGAQRLAYQAAGVDLLSISDAGALQIGGTAGPTWTQGSGAPFTTQPVGSLYSRVGGAVGATLYVSRGAGTWAAVAGV